MIIIIQFKYCQLRNADNHVDLRVFALYFTSKNRKLTNGASAIVGPAGIIGVLVSNTNTSKIGYRIAHAVYAAPIAVI